MFYRNVSIQMILSATSFLYLHLNAKLDICTSSLSAALFQLHQFYWDRSRVIIISIQSEPAKWRVQKVQKTMANYPLFFQQTQAQLTSRSCSNVFSIWQLSDYQKALRITAECDFGVCCRHSLVLYCLHIHALNTGEQKLKWKYSTFPLLVFWYYFRNYGGKDISNMANVLATAQSQNHSRLSNCT